MSWIIFKKIEPIDQPIYNWILIELSLMQPNYLKTQPNIIGLN